MCRIDEEALKILTIQWALFFVGLVIGVPLALYMGWLP